MAKKRGAGEGLVRQRADGRWEARLSLGWRNGKRQRHSVYGTTQAEVLDQLAEARQKHKNGMPIASTGQTVGEFLTHWLEDSARPRIRPRTYDRFSELIRLHLNPALGAVRLEKLSPAHVQGFMTHKRKEEFAAQTIVSMRNVLRAALNQALRWGIVGRNVATLVDAPRIERPSLRILTEDETRRLLETARGKRFEGVYTLGLALGLRRGELLGLKWEDVDLDHAQIRIVRSLQRIGKELLLTETKTAKSRRTLPLPQNAVRALRTHRKRQLEGRLATGPAWRETDLVFTNSTGGPVEPVTLHRDFKRVLRDTGLPAIRFHNLRHTAASLMLARGVPLKIIQEILGHSSIAVTSGFYAHLTEQLKRDAAEVMDRVLDGR